MRKFYFVCTVVLIFSAYNGFAQPSYLDASFGNGGKVITPIDTFSVAGGQMIIQADGKIIEVGIVQQLGVSFNGTCVIVRYNTDGTLDNSFGTGGLVLSNFASGYQRSRTLALQPDGKILVGGTVRNNSNFDKVLVRLTNNGTVDSSFGINGIIVTDLGGSDHIYKIVLKPDGKIIAGGYNTSFSGMAVLTQYTSAGSLDSSFGINGVAMSPAYGGLNPIGITGLAIQDDGKIITCGYSSNLEVFRFLPNGTIDSAFGHLGRAIFNLSGTANDLSLQQDGKIVCTGQVFINGISKMGLVRLKIDGNLDSSFGINGAVITDIDTSASWATSIQIQADGKLLVGGTNSIGSTTPGLPFNYRGNFVLLRYNSDGLLDTTFGVQGVITTDFGLQDNAFASIIQPDGKVILSGRVSDSTKYSIGLARYSFYVLPLKLLSFNAIKQAKINLLQWSTSQEINVDRFNVQRSSNGKEYNNIGNVKAGLSNYSFVDEQPLKETNYYRLKMIDKDGKFEYSLIKKVNNSKDFVVNLYPNPVYDKLQVQIESVKRMLLQVQIIDLTGSILLIAKWDVTEGTSMRMINLSGLRKGSYFIKIISANEVKASLNFEKLN